MKSISLILALILSCTAFSQNMNWTDGRYNYTFGIDGALNIDLIAYFNRGASDARTTMVSVTPERLAEATIDRAERNLRFMGASRRDLSFQESRVLRSIQWQMQENISNLRELSARFNRDAGELLSQYKRQLEILPTGRVRIIEPTHGLGFNSSLTYYGDWQNKKQHGFGVESWETTVNGQKVQEVFEGKFVDGQREGFGKLSRGDLRFEGSFKRGLYDGFGLMERKDEDGFTYVGAWKAHRHEGLGFKAFLNGKKISGNFQAGQPEGFAQTTYPDGETYTGHHTQGSIDGHGVLDLSARADEEGFTSLSGEFNRSEFRGFGVARTNKGETRIGTFEGKEHQVEVGVRLTRDYAFLGNFSRNSGILEVGEGLKLGSWSRNGFTATEVNPTSELLRLPIYDANRASRDVLKKGFKGVTERFEQLKKMQIPDPVFKNPQSLKAAELLALTYQEGAESLFERALAEKAPDSTLLSMGVNYLKSAHEVLRFAEGIGSGLVEQSLVSIRDDAVAVLNFVRSDLTDLRKLTDSIIAVKETISRPEFYQALKKFTEEKWEAFKVADSFTKGQMVRDLIAAQVPALLTAGLGHAVKGTQVMQALTRMAQNPLLRSSKRVGEMVEDLATQSPPQGVVRAMDDLAHLVHTQRGSTSEASELLSTVVASGGVYETHATANAEKILKALKDHGNLNLTNRELIRGWAHSFRFSPVSADRADDIAKNLFASPYAREALGSTPSGRPAFYLASDGKAVPATGYKHFRSSDQRLMESIAKTGVIPNRADGNYITFNRFNNSEDASSWLQVTHDAAFRVTLDTRDRVNDLVIPRANYGGSNYLEPITVSQSFGSGGATQAVTTKEFSRILEIKNIRTGEVLYPKKP